MEPTREPVPDTGFALPRRARLPRREEALMMYPGFHWWRQRHHGADFGVWTGGCGPAFEERGSERYRAGRERFGDFGGGAFGVRRPLRFLAYKLDLDERQVSELAKILTDLKTERA